MKTMVIFLGIMFLTGCSNRAVYENIQIDKRNECLTLPPAEYDDCMVGIDKPYDEYERERREAIEK